MDLKIVSIPEGVYVIMRAIFSLNKQTNYFEQTRDEPIGFCVNRSEATLFVNQYNQEERAFLAQNVDLQYKDAEGDTNISTIQFYWLEYTSRRQVDELNGK